MKLEQSKMAKRIKGAAPPQQLANNNKSIGFQKGNRKKEMEERKHHEKHQFNKGHPKWKIEESKHYEKK